MAEKERKGRKKEREEQVILSSFYFRPLNLLRSLCSLVSNHLPSAARGCNWIEQTLAYYVREFLSREQINTASRES